MRCKKGDLAVVIKSEAGNEGLFVKVGEYVPGPDLYVYPDGLTNADEGWLCYGKRIKVTESSGYHREAVFPDDHLWPIRPPKPSKEVKTETEHKDEIGVQ